MGLSILIVDDHEAVRAAVRDWLVVAFRDARFIEAKTGEEALALASTHRPDLVLMDLGLPVMNGIEATRRIKTILPETHVVILTIYDAVEYRKDAEAAGASAYVLKHCVTSELLSTLARLQFPSEPTLNT